MRQGKSGRLPNDQAAVVANAPLQRPTLRMQDGDIILEDGRDIDPVRAAQHPILADSTSQQQQQLSSLHVTPPQPSPLTPAAISLAVSPLRESSRQFTGVSMQAQMSKDDNAFATAAAAATTGVTTPDGGSKSNGAIGSFRLHFDPGPASGGSSKMRTTELTTSNIQQLLKQGGDSAKASTSERMWQWLEAAGPPYDVQPSVGVTSRPSLPLSNQPGLRSRRKGSVLSRLLCFRCSTPP